ncbi:ATP-binding protein [Planktothrix pseudagardhii]|uniref:WD repeat-containing protein alr2800 n=1 Tax=Planktothrix pseudagardhii TaxID=132604 RepID=A0A9W4CLS4_9CYAN|nr:ATP-binding protein [Planktothrix pseudagardhii]CAD5955851.1 putative WD repeat-containing protein alr2800 [Planktothrix pseudagardhii]
MVGQTFTASKEGHQKIQTAIADRKWKVSEQDTRPLVIACYRYIEEYQQKHQLSDNDPRWLKDFEQIFRVERDKRQTQEHKQEKLDKIKWEILKNNKFTFLEKIKTLIDSGEIYVQNISWGTWSRFASHKTIYPVNVNAFKIYCAILDLDWRKITENEPQQFDNFSLKSNLHELPHQPIFYGRENELNQLLEWLNNKQTRVILLSGMSGIGKTSLIINLLDKITDQFECIIYKNLSNPKSFSLFWHDLTEQPTNVTGDIKQIIDYFRNHRCLLILDNWEELLKSEHLAGYYRQEYEEYGELLSQIAKTSHQSCGLFISQEKPRQFELLLSQQMPVYSWDLKGLDPASALQIFEQQGLGKDTQSLTNLIRRYSYHPGVLNLVAQDIKQEFNGNILQYFKQSSLLVSDVISNYIIQAFTKLSAKEIDIIYLLAIITENLSQEQLKQVFDHYLSGTDILDTMKSLKRRSLLIQDANNTEITYSLPPFIKKYVSNLFMEKFCANIIAVIKTQNWQNIGLLRTHPLVYPNPNKNLINPKLSNKIIDKLINLNCSEDLYTQLKNLLLQVDSDSGLGYFQINISHLFSVINHGNRKNN